MIPSRLNLREKVDVITKIASKIFFNIDFTKAFDCVEQETLVHNLRSLKSIIMSFLSWRTQNVNLDIEQSLVFCVMLVIVLKLRLPQGSVLGYVLF